MDIIQAIMERRSIHVFQQKEIHEDILRKIFTYASYAPTHYMKESWNIKVYQKDGKNKLVFEMINSYKRLGMLKTGNDKKTKQMIASMTKFLLSIPHHALIYLPIEEDPIRYEEEYASVCAFIQNAQLAAWKYGIGMLWTITPYMHDPCFVEAIRLNAQTTKIAAVLQIGYPEKIPKLRHRTPIEQKLEFINS